MIAMFTIGARAFTSNIDPFGVHEMGSWFGGMPVPSQHPVLPPSSVWNIFPLDVKSNGEARQEHIHQLVGEI